MKSFIKVFSLALFLSVTSTSCKKSFLNVPLPREKNANDYLVDLTTANEFFNGIMFTVASKLYDGQAIAYADVAADNAKGASLFLVSQYNWNMIASDGASNFVDNGMNPLWLRGYGIVRSCNYLLERIDKFRSENAAIADGIKGQLYAIRALTHFNLVNVFAQQYSFTPDGGHPGIPYDTIYSQTEIIQRQSVQDVYEHVINDLKRALIYVPASLTGKSNFNQTAIKAVLARVYLFKGDYLNANQLSASIASQVPLLPSANYPGKLFTTSDTESLFWFPPGQASTGWAEYQGSYYWRTSSGSATADLRNIISERPLDLRRNWFKDTVGIIQIRKFPRGVVAGISDQNISYYQSVIRSSEMFLTAAESFAQLGNIDSARFYLDAVRRRADATAPVSVASGTALLDSIYKERRKELCFENLRLFDVLRLKKNIVRADVNSPAPSTLAYPNNKAIAPIPLIDVRVYGLQQNQGY